MQHPRVLLLRLERLLPGLVPLYTGLAQVSIREVRSRQVHVAQVRALVLAMSLTEEEAKEGLAPPSFAELMGRLVCGAGSHSVQGSQLTASGLQSR